MLSHPQDGLNYHCAAPSVQEAAQSQQKRKPITMSEPKHHAADVEAQTSHDLPHEHEHEEEEEPDSPINDPKDESSEADPKEKVIQQPRRRRPSLVGSALRVVRTQSSATAAAAFSHPLSHSKTGPELRVDFEGKDDPYNPKNWPFKKKVITTALYGFTTMGSTIASSIYASGIDQISSEFHVGTEVSTLGISFLLFGFGIGPLIWAPLSEVYGRKQAVLIPYFISAVFAFGTATAKDIQTVLITRFFAGFFGAAPVTNTGGVLGDIWDAKTRGTAIVGYALAVVAGPTLGPIMGGAIVQSYLGWRWTEYLTGIIQLFVLLLDIIFVEETYPPTLLVYKARRLRFQSGNWALHAAHEEWDVSIKDLTRKYLVRPMNMLATPICLSMATYASFVYAIFYAQLAAFPIVYQEIRGWGQVTGALPFLSLLIGMLIGAGANIVNQQFYIKAYTRGGGHPVPEARLPPMMIGSVLFTGGSFMFAWTCAPVSIPWIVSNIGLALVGCAFFMIFQAALNYLVDTFQRYGASAVAANTFLRSVFAGAFPLFIKPMYHGIGPNWAGSVFAFVSVLLIPIPYLFYVKGKEIRRRGVWSRESVHD
ncbi:hypothetical protein FH972_021564 [Carpinus fangiana]|uniref:Major facilitator superfamily (MFS) profile domain-containing protein n=1 Tax=Carpinus fangiana TaxID=176857 RepID=A0A5N6KPM7_9ROSI|nr:hypothetical protein FH972_021564 [Carpinus fangiana]